MENRLADIGQDGFCGFLKSFLAIDHLVADKNRWKLVAFRFQFQALLDFHQSFVTALLVEVDKQQRRQGRWIHFSKRGEPGVLQPLAAFATAGSQNHPGILRGHWPSWLVGRFCCQCGHHTQKQTGQQPEEPSPMEGGHLPISPLTCTSMSFQPFGSSTGILTVQRNKPGSS